MTLQKNKRWPTGKSYKLEDVPPDVIKVWATQWFCTKYNTGVGKQMYDECITIMKKYPEFFPFKENDKVILPDKKQKL